MQMSRMMRTPPVTALCGPMLTPQCIPVSAHQGGLNESAGPALRLLASHMFYG